MQDLKILQLRGVLDRKKHFKSADSKALPKYFQMGRIVEGAADHYRDGVTSKHKKRRLVDELLDDAEFRRYNKKKFVDLSQVCATTDKRSGLLPLQHCSAEPPTAC